MSTALWLVVAIALGVASCDERSDLGPIPSRATFGVYRSSSGAFFGVGYPCHGIRVSAVELGVLESKENGVYTTVLRLEYDNPVDMGSVAMPFSSEVNGDGATVSVVDDSVLDRVSTDRQFLTSVRDDYYLVLRFFSVTGEETTGIQNLGSRFDIDNGSVDLLGDEFPPDLRCDDGSAAWPGLAGL